MDEDFPIKGLDQTIINKRFEATHFHCIRCGSMDIEKSEIGYYSNGSNDSHKDTEGTFFVSGMLYCKRCKHNFSQNYRHEKRIE